MPKNCNAPALPPKKQKLSSSNASLNIITPPISPKISNENVFTQTKNIERTSTEILPSQTVSKNSEKETTLKDDFNEPEVVILRKKPAEKSLNLMEQLDVQDYLIFKKDNLDLEPTLIGGQSDALIIHATKNTVHKLSEGNVDYNKQAVDNDEMPSYNLSIRMFLSDISHIY